MVHLVDRFNTRDGSWEPNSLPYSITRAVVDKYGADDIPGKGAANHIHVKAQPGSIINVNTTDTLNPVNYYVPDSGWVNHPMAHSSAYVPSRGEQGPWIVSVDGVEVARGIGLPDGLHVSTFLVTDDLDATPAPLPPTDPSTDRAALLAIKRIVDAQLGDQ